MAVTNVTLKTTFAPNDEQTQFYFTEPVGINTSISGVRIEWTDGEADTPYTLEYSADGGSTWDTIVTGITAAYYHWYPTPSEYAILFPSGNENLLVQIRVSDSDVGVDATPSSTFRKVSITGVVPNKDTTDPTGTDTHVARMHYSDAFNILWDELYESGAGSVDVYIYKDLTPYLIYEAIPLIQFNAVWSFANYVLPGTANNFIPKPTTTTGLYTIVIRGTSGGQHQTNMFQTTTFMITKGEKNHTYDDFRSLMPAERIDTFKRIGGEKGRRLDEATVVGQFEAGRGVKVIQRDDKGRRVGANGYYATFTGDPDTGELTPDTENPRKANNIVISIDESQLSIKTARSMQGIFTPTTLVTEWQAGEFYYGTMYSYLISHNWELGNPADPEYKVGQNRNSFFIDIRNITDDDVYDPLKPVQDTWVQYEPINANQIKCYVVKKGGAIQPDLAKDEVSVTSMSDYKFEFVLTERIPSI